MIPEVVAAGSTKLKLLSEIAVTAISVPSISTEVTELSPSPVTTRVPVAGASVAETTTGPV